MRRQGLAATAAYIVTPHMRDAQAATRTHAYVTPQTRALVPLPACPRAHAIPLGVNAHVKRRPSLLFNRSEHIQQTRCHRPPSLASTMWNACDSRSPNHQCVAQGIASNVCVGVVVVVVASVVAVMAVTQGIVLVVVLVCVWVVGRGWRGSWFVSLVGVVRVAWFVFGWLDVALKREVRASWCACASTLLDFFCFLPPHSRSRAVL